MAAKLLTDASYTKRDKKQEALDYKAGKRANAGFADLTPIVTKPKEIKEEVTVPKLTKAEIAAAKKEAKDAVIAEEKARLEAEAADKAGEGK